MTAASPTIFLVDDDVVVLFSLRQILHVAGYKTEAFEHPAALLSRLSPQDFGCALLDLQMPGMTGLQLQQALSARGVTMPLIFVSGSADIPQAIVAMKQGAVDFLVKPVDPQQLLVVVAAALRKATQLIADSTLRQQAQALWAMLTAREREVCSLCADGLLNKQIAAQLDMAESTAQSHRARAFAKLGITSSHELTRLLTRLAPR